MKKRIQVTVMVLTMLFGLFGCSGEARKTITTLETMTLTVRGMRGTSVYEIVTDAEKTELLRYREAYVNGEDVRILEKSTLCDTQAMIERMNTCGILRWNGFHGKHPKNVLDRDMFVFEASVNHGQTIYADGSANYPKGYREFVRALDQLLSESGG